MNIRFFIVMWMFLVAAFCLLKWNSQYAGKWRNIVLIFIFLVSSFINFYWVPAFLQYCWKVVCWKRIIKNEIFNSNGRRTTALENLHTQNDNHRSQWALVWSRLKQGGDVKTVMGSQLSFIYMPGARRDRVVVRYATTCAISVYDH